jgi:hypothetical protein
MAGVAARKASDCRLLNETAPNGKTGSALVEIGRFEGSGLIETQLIAASASSNLPMT